MITRVRLRVHPVPEAKRYEAWSFPDFATGAAALRAITQTGTGATVVRLSDEVETGVNLATTHSIGEQSSTGGCLGVTMFEGTPEHAESRHAETRAVLLAHGGTSLGEETAKNWEKGRFDAPVPARLPAEGGCAVRDAGDGHDLVERSEAQGGGDRSLTTALTASGTPALVMCHISHVYPTGASVLHHRGRTTG